LVPTCLCKPGFVEFVGIDCAEEGWNRSKPIVPPFTVLTKGTQKESQGKFIANPVILFANPAGPSLGCGVELAFSVSFTFSLIPQSGTFGSNGFAFVISAKAKVGNPDGVGYGGVETRSVAIEFDTRWNDNHGDINSQHVGLNVNGMDQSLVAEVSPFTLNDGSAYTAWVDYEPGDPGTIRVFLANLNVKPEERSSRSTSGTVGAWRVADRRALTVLLATIPPTLKRELASTSSSHLWRLLTDLYDRQDVATLYSLIKEFQSLTMNSTTGAAAFTRRVLDLARRLAALGVPYPDPVLCCHLLEGLTPDFDTHKIAYMQLIDKRITPAEVAQWIITTEADLLRYSSSTAAIAQQRNTRGGRGATGSVTPFPSSGFVGMVSQAGTPAPSMYSAAINENVIQYSVPSPPPHPPPSTTLDFVLDSGATESVLCDAGTLHLLPAPTSLLGADSSFSIPCRHTSTLPCPLFPSGTVTGLHIASLCTNLLSQRSLQQAGITTVFPGRANHCLLYHPTALLPISPDLSGTPVFAFSSAPTIFVPATYEEAMACPDAHLWLATILKELEAFIANSSFVDVPRPPSTTNMVKGKWVFRVKQLPGEPSVYKARYVAKGFTQRYDVHFFDTFSPTAKPATIRAVLDLAARLNMEIHSMDVSNAFLQGVLRKLIYMERPAGFHLPFPSDSVWQLRRPVYGLKQAPREWHAKLAATLAELGFSTSRADPSLFLRTSPSPFYILVYVDDMILITADSVELERVKRELGSRLKCKDLGELQHYLGMEITRDRAARTISLSQSHYLQQVLEWFDMARGTPQVTPLPVGHHLTPLTSPSSSSHPYAELIGSLMYAMVSTRPDLAYPISVLARFVGTGKHDAAHWQAAKRVLRYLQGTKDYVLTLGGPSPPLLTGYSDSSWADSRPDRCSSQGYGFSLGSGLISWRSTRSSSIALSSCEAELYAATMAAQEVRWLTFLLEELGAPQRCPTIWCDNASTIHLTKDAVFHGRSKHIELRHYFIRELVQGDHLQLGKIDSAANLADTFTKALPHAAHSSLLRLLGLAPPIPLSAS
ncbi:hypothetical protein CLOP_g8666, partial [Closterium sp. NIES-67]